MKLEEGMYVRFKDKKGNQYIRKITSVNSEYPNKLYAGIYIDKNANNCNGVSLKNIIKASYNLIDLIEVGDYVNGIIVTEIKSGKPYHEDYNDPYFSYYFEEKDIESIVTKEQFRNSEYCEVIKND